MSYRSASNMNDALPSSVCFFTSMMAGSQKLKLELTQKVQAVVSKCKYHKN